MRRRRGLALAGLLLLVVGLLLAAIPDFPTAPETLSVPSVGTHALFEQAAPADLLFPRVSFSVSWSSSENGTNLTVYACGSDPVCPVPPATVVAFGAGSSGTLSFLGSANEYYLLVPQHGAVSVTVVVTEPWLGAAPGMALLLAGLGLGAAGLTGGRRRGRRVAGGSAARPAADRRAPPETGPEPPGRSGQA